MVAACFDNYAQRAMQILHGSHMVRYESMIYHLSVFCPFWMMMPRVSLVAGVPLMV